MLVPDSLEEHAIRRAKEITQRLCLGDPTAPDTELGPLVSSTQYNRVIDYIRKGMAEGAKLVVGGPERPKEHERGYYVKPTIFSGVDSAMTIAQEESFGPVLCILTYKDEDDAIRIANDSKYGLAAYVATSDGERANRVAGRLRVGQVRAQGSPFDGLAPFGGYKMSGNGRELGVMGFEEYQETKACIGINWRGIQKWSGDTGKYNKQ